MKKIQFSIAFTTIGLVIFIILCSMPNIPFGFVYSFFLLLLLSFFRMVLVILKNGTPPTSTFDQQFYEDADFPNKS